MRTVTLQSVLWGVANLLGLDPTRDLNPARAAHLTEYMNTRFKEGWRYDFFPEWTVVEQRYYRDVYAAGQFIEAGDQRYLIGSGKYYQALQAQSLASEAPATFSSGTWTLNSGWWAELSTTYSAAQWDANTYVPVGSQAKNPDDLLVYQRTTNLKIDGAGGGGDENTIWIQSGRLNGKPKYVRQSDGTDGIRWSGTQWEIYSQIIVGVTHSSTEDVTTPDLVQQWNNSLFNPSPTFVSPQPPDPVFWGVLTPFDRYIAYEQTNQTPIDAVKRICRRNPRVYPRNPGEIRPFTVSERGVQVPSTAPNIVFVEFRLRPPTFTSTRWLNGTAYDQDALVYFLTDTFKSEIGNNSEPVDGVVNWSLVPFPEILAGFVKRAAFSDALSDQKQQSRKLVELDRAYAELADALDRELDSQGQYETATVQTYGS